MSITDSKRGSGSEIPSILWVRVCLYVLYVLPLKSIRTIWHESQHVSTNSCPLSSGRRPNCSCNTVEAFDQRYKQGSGWYDACVFKLRKANLRRKKPKERTDMVLVSGKRQRDSACTLTDAGQGVTARISLSAQRAQPVLTLGWSTIHTLIVATNFHQA